MREPDAGLPAERVEATCAADQLFGVLWNALVDLLGSAAAATLIRRSAKHASARAPGLAALQVIREQFEYRYALPPSWSWDAAAVGELRELCLALRPLLVELTGQVVVHRLGSIHALVRCGLFERR